MIPVLAKTLIGAGISAAVVGSGGYGIYCFVTAPKTIKEQFIKDGLTPLNLAKEGTNADSSEWDKKLAKYKEEGSSESRFDDLPVPNSGSGTVTLDNLKDSCQKTLNMSLSDSKASVILDKVKKWCFKGTL